MWCCLDEMDGDVHTSYEAVPDPTLLEQMELLVDTTRLRLVPAELHRPPGRHV